MRVQCELCPKRCTIAPGESGDCRIRVNVDGKLVATTCGFPCAVHVDPVEKKPLFHFRPGSPILSVATVGCNLHCRNCQNWEISQANPETSRAVALPATALPGLCRQENCTAVAYTYTEPLAWYEYTLDCCRAVRAAGGRNVLVTAGYVNEGPFRELARHLDAANIDLKAFSDTFYREVCGGTLAPVLRTLEVAREMGVWVEVTNLLIPTLNDDERLIGDLCAWVRDHLGAETPLHFSRFAPHYRMRNLPPTPGETLERARNIARDAGLEYVYIGNLMVADAGDTRCPGCGKLLVARRGFTVRENNLENGRCPSCQRTIFGIWK